MKATWGAALVGALAGLSLGFALWGPEAAPIETAAPAVTQEDGSVILERAPNPEAEPAHQIPAGATVERSVSVTVRPDPLPSVPRGTPAPDLSTPRGLPEKPEVADTACRCADVTLDLSLIRLPDGTRRVIASATGGRIVGGVDVPIESAAPARVLRWGAGVEYDLNAGAWGGVLERDLDRLLVVPLPTRLGLSITPNPQHGSARIGLRATIRF